MGSRIWRSTGAVLIALGSLITLASAQGGGSISGQVIQPGPPNGSGGPAGFATVQVCPITSTGTPCSPLSTLFLDPALTISSPNPATADQYGNYSLWTAPGPVIVQVTPINGIVYSYLTEAVAGTVTSVGVSMPGIFNVANSPVTSSGVINVTLAGQAPNLVFASPAGSIPGQPLFRSLVPADLLPQAANTVIGNCTGALASPTACLLIANMIPGTLNATNFAGNVGVTGTLSTTGNVLFSGGTSLLPITSLSFATPYISGLIYDRSPQTANGSAPADNHIAPAALDQVYESGAATTVPRMLIGVQTVDAAATGGIYGLIIDSETLRGNRPIQQLGMNIVSRNGTEYPITTTVRSGNVSTVTLANPILNNGLKITDCIFISGVSDPSFDTTPNGCVTPSAISSNTITYGNPGANTSSSGGTAAYAFYFSAGYELNIFQDNKQNGPISPVLSQNNPFNNGLAITSNGLYGPTDAIFITGTTTANKPWEGIVCGDVRDWCFVAGYPQTGAPSLQMAGGYLADSVNTATAGNNYNSVLTAWRDSWWNGTAPQTTVFATQLTANAGTSPQSHLDFITPNAVISLFQNGQIIPPDGVVGAPSYSFVGDPTSGIYRDSFGNIDAVIVGQVKTMVATGSQGVMSSQFTADLGIACSGGELALSGGWGSSALVTTVAGQGQTCEWTISSAGSGQGANPTITDTLTMPLPSALEVCSMTMAGGTGSATLIDQTTLSSTAPVFTFIGTPVVGNTYRVIRRCGP